MSDLKREDVARVLASRLLKIDAGRCRAIDASRHHDVAAAEEALDAIYEIVDALSLSPEFDAALKRLEEERRG